MLKLNSDLNGALTNFLILLEQGDYFEAHEVLEEAWHYLRLSKEPDESLVKLVKGIINGAIAFEHIKRDRKNARDKAQKVIASYDRYKGLYNENRNSACKFKEVMDSIDEIRRRLFFLED